MYNENGQRVRKNTGSTWTEYYYGPGGNLQSEYNGSWPVQYVYAGSRMLAIYQNGTTDFVHADQLGSTRLVTAVNQSIVDNMDYEPFGQQTAGGSATTHKFTGKQRDGEDGLDYFGARYYSSSMGRFMSPDWSSRPEGVPYAQLDNPQSLNLYGYVGNDPVDRVDPDGHFMTLAEERASWGGESAANAITDYAMPTDEDWAAEKAAQSQAKNLGYNATILGQTVSVTIIGGTANAQKAIRGRLDAAFGDINKHAGQLSAADINTIHNIKSITVNDQLRSGLVNLKAGTLNLRSTYVMAPGSSTAWLASVVAHDAYHVTQYQQGLVYDRKTAPGLERAADAFQMRVGARFGLTPAELNYLKNDRHTYYNTPPY